MAAMLTDSSHLMGVTEAAEILGIDRATFIRWIKAGKFTAATKLPGSNGPYLVSGPAVRHLARHRLQHTEGSRTA